MVANRVVAISERVEYYQTKIAGAVRGHRETPLQLEIATFGAIDFLFEVTSQAELVAGLSQQFRITSPVGKVAALTSKPVNRSVCNLARPPTLILVAGQADSAARRAQQTLLARSMGGVAIDTLGDFQRCVRHRRTLDLALQIGVTGITQCGSPTFDQLRSRSQVTSGTGVLERGVDRAGREQRLR